MQDKIDWYQEVVNLEPSSKLFFPLAKMLADKDAQRAIATLQQGLDRHPEFIEARLYFVELLHKHKDSANNQDKLNEQLALLSPMMMRYAGFWQAWGKDMAEHSGQDHKALAIAFLGAVFKDASLSMGDIFAKGLQSVLDTTAQNSSPKPYYTEVQQNSINEFENTKVQPEVQQNLINELENNEYTKYVEPENIPANIQHSDNDNKALKPRISVKVASGKAENLANYAQTTEQKTEEEKPLSVRTRSMAEVLAEQGDYNGALEIYKELIHASKNSEERLDLQSRMTTLKGFLRSDPVKEAPKVTKSLSSGKERVISVLESLADRLENRVQS